MQEEAGGTAATTQGPGPALLAIPKAKPLLDSQTKERIEKGTYTI